MHQLTQHELNSKINRFLNRKTAQLHLDDDPLEGIQPRMRDISPTVVVKSYKYMPTHVQRLFNY